MTVHRLWLLIDSGVGIGGSWDGSSQAGVAQLEALLAQLPLGLAMTDRDGRFLFGNDAFLRSIGRDGEGLPSFPTDLGDARRQGCFVRCRASPRAVNPATRGDMAVRLGLPTRRTCFHGACRCARSRRGCRSFKSR